MQMPYQNRPTLASRQKVGPRERALAEWRRVNTAPLEIERTRSEKKAADLLPGILKGIRIDQRQAEAEIVTVWNHTIDPKIAAHAKPVGIAKGTLFVDVDSSVWLDEIVRYRRKEILQRLQHSFGAELITKISFRLGG